MDAELRHLRSFVMVAEELSFTRAAHRLHITQQSLSATIKQLETVVGGQLLVRTTRAVRLTEAGDVLLTRAREALSAADDAVSRTRAALGRLEGRVSGGLALDLAPLLNSTLDRFQDHHPAVQLALTTGLEVQLFDELSLGRLDFVVNWAPPPPELGLDHTALLAAEAFVLTHADHPLASRSAIERADLDHEPLIIFPRWVAPYSYANILRLLGDGPEAPRQVIEVPLLDSGVDAIARAVATGTGIGVVGPTAAARDLDQDLVLRHLTPPLLSPVELVWCTDGSHRTGAVVDALLDSRPGAMDGRPCGGSRVTADPPATPDRRPNSSAPSAEHDAPRRGDALGQEESPCRPGTPGRRAQEAPPGRCRNADARAAGPRQRAVSHRR